MERRRCFIRTRARSQNKNTDSFFGAARKSLD